MIELISAETRPVYIGGGYLRFDVGNHQKV